MPITYVNITKFKYVVFVITQETNKLNKNDILQHNLLHIIMPSVHIP